MCKIFGRKIRSCKFFDKSQVCSFRLFLHEIHLLEASEKIWTFCDQHHIIIWWSIISSYLPYLLFKKCLTTKAIYHLKEYHLGHLCSPPWSHIHDDQHTGLFGRRPPSKTSAQFTPGLVSAVHMFSFCPLDKYYFWSARLWMQVVILCHHYQSTVDLACFAFLLNFPPV